jgi:hypothetical protein
LISAVGWSRFSSFAEQTKSWLHHLLHLAPLSITIVYIPLTRPKKELLAAAAKSVTLDYIPHYYTFSIIVHHIIMQDARFVLPRNELIAPLSQPPSITRILQSGDKLPFSPISLIDPIGGGGGGGGGGRRHVKKPKSRINLGDYDSNEYDHRDLGGSNDNQQQSYLVDSSGNAYEPYSLAWRYLGMYIDCDFEPAASSSSYEDDEFQGNYDRRNTRTRRRRTSDTSATTATADQRSLGGSGDSGDGDCERVLLWAAVSFCFTVEQCV